MPLVTVVALSIVLLDVSVSVSETTCYFFIIVIVNFCAVLVKCIVMNSHLHLSAPKSYSQIFVSIAQMPSLCLMLTVSLLSLQMVVPLNLFSIFSKFALLENINYKAVQWLLSVVQYVSQTFLEKLHTTNVLAKHVIFIVSFFNLKL